MQTTLELIEEERDEADRINDEIQQLRDEINDKLRELEGCKEVAQENFNLLVDYLEFSKGEDEEVEDDEEYQAAERFLEEIDNWIDNAS